LCYHEKSVSIKIKIEVEVKDLLEKMKEYFKTILEEFSYALEKLLRQLFNEIENRLKNYLSRLYQAIKELLRDLLADLLIRIKEALVTIRNRIINSLAIRMDAAIDALPKSKHQATSTII
jgi:F0F1-type ATP synthase membrane subunit b/b'